MAKMNCPDCGVAMNQHAVKVAEPTSPEEAARVDPELGGVAREVHCCPECGRNAVREA